MVTIIYNHANNSMHEQYSSTKGLLVYNKSEKYFSCEASDLECAGVKDLPHEFIVKIEENGHTRHFRYTRFKKDDEGDVLYWNIKQVMVLYLQFLTTNKIKNE